ncbi:hypothetical protein JCGZ_15715 [Jatropha curcas]|uniref:RNA helicase n=1 Tax=Jatropha curcas TaxID=180498 RepID=A0A067L277_JATCU|nr:DEAD-box ATP-dependent RNA helicase 35-like [Jatropha curcas]KDP41308.1 hypothetical protein JCGZ_15715 [Jatropha curcas]
MGFPQPILNVLKAKGISQPTPIQTQCLPVILSGSDMIGVSSTGSGKTLAFVFPLIMIALQEEIMMPILSGEGPFGLIISPSRELAVHTHQLIAQFLASMGDDFPYPELRSMLCIGGVNMKAQLEIMKMGVHIVVATPGRLKDILGKRKMNLDQCRYLTLDEGDRLLGLGFGDDIRKIISYFKGQRQTLVFYATMPAEIQNFAMTGLVKPVLVNVGIRAGSANLNVLRVKSVEENKKNEYLFSYLQKTPSAVLIFCRNKTSVDDIHLQLLQKGIDAAAIHGYMDQEEREYAILSFGAGKKEVLVATDVASKGLDFPDI